MSNPLFTINADIRQFEQALIRFQSETQLGWPEVIKMQTRLLVERLIEWTPPFGKNKAAQRQGTIRVQKDINKVFIAFRDVPFLVKEIAQQRLYQFSQEKDFQGIHFKNSKIQKTWEQRNWDILEKIFENTQPAKSRQLQFSHLLDPSRHQAARIAGRVPKRQNPQIVIKKASQLKNYIKQVQKKVGKSKSGWIPAAKALGVKFPAWIMQSTNLGGIRDSSNAPNNPKIAIFNEVPYVSEIFPNSKLNELIATRIRDMTQNARRFLDAKRRKAGL